MHAVPPIHLDRTTLLERELRATEHGLQRARDRIAQAEAEAAALRADLTELERRLEHAAAEPARLRAELERVQARRWAAEQLAQSERALREELEEELAQLRRSPGAQRRDPGASQALRLRVRELEEEVARLERSLAEAEHALAASRAGGGKLAEAVERPASTEAVAGVEAPAVPRMDPPAAPRGARTALEVERLSAALDRLRSAARPTTEPEPERESEAAVGLGRWPAAALRRVAEVDPAAAGAIVLSLLPAQHLVAPGPLAYDLLLEGEGMIEVTVRDAGTHVERRSLGAGPPAEGPRAVDFLLQGSLAALAGLLLGSQPAAGQARVRGNATALNALRELIESGLSLEQLLAAGVRMGPMAALTLAAAAIELVILAGAIEPEPRDGRELILGYVSPDGLDHAHLRVVPGQRPQAVRSAPAGGHKTLVICEGEVLAEVLADRPEAQFELVGRPEELAAVRRWLARAQGLGTDSPI